MAELPECSGGEDIVKGVLSTDVQDGVVNPSLFAGKESSYSRLEVYSLKKILRVFRRELPDPPKKLLAGYLVLNVAQMKAVAKGYTHKGKEDGYIIGVYPDPLPGFLGNKAHAVTKPKITDGLAKRISKQAIKKRVDYSVHQRQGILDSLYYWLVTRLTAG